MPEFMTPEEVAERERAVDVFMAPVAQAEMQKEDAIGMATKDAAEIRDELERLYEIEKLYDDRPWPDERH